MIKLGLSNRLTSLALGSIILIGATLRFYNLNWDNGLTFHPDERNIDAAVSRVEFFDQMDPEFFAYGGLPVYLYNATTEILAEITKNESWKYDWGMINHVGRTYSAIFSTITLFLIFILSRKLFNTRVGLISSALSAFAPSFIQTAHYAITESVLTMMVVLITYLSIDLHKKLTLKRIVALATILGISVSAKTSAISFTILPATTFLIKFSEEKKKLRSLTKYIPRGILFVTIVVLVFTVFSPYTFLSWDNFIESMKYESGVVNGSRPVPYTLQFTNTLPYLFQLKNIFWQIGLVAAISYVGIIVLIVNATKKRLPHLLIFLSFPVVYFMYVGSWHTKFIRYMVPILPALLISAGYLFDQAIKKYKKLGSIVTFIFLLVTIIWGLAFFSVYTNEQTRVSSSRWFFNNIPPGSKILTEHWDDGLPIYIEDTNLRQEDYNIEQLTIYEADNEEKLQYFSEKLSGADYILLNSRRLYGTLINLGKKYPLTSKYYKLLFSGGLGYSKIAEFTSYPSLFGYEINDDPSEETFQVYDHNKVVIFKNTKRLNVIEIEKILRN